jgi:hypothetical protein
MSKKRTRSRGSQNTAEKASATSATAQPAPPAAGTSSGALGAAPANGAEAPPIPAKRRKNQHRNGYELKEQLPAYKPYALNSPGYPRREALVVHTKLSIFKLKVHLWKSSSRVWHRDYIPCARCPSTLRAAAVSELPSLDVLISCQFQAV